MFHYIWTAEHSSLTNKVLFPSLGTTNMMQESQTQVPFIQQKIREMTTLSQ